VDADALYAAPLALFVTVRKELAQAAKAAGDRDGAARIAKLARPTPAAWAVNQLWRVARREWDELDRATRAIAGGDLGAAAHQRAALAALRGRAIELARAVDQPASEAMLARLETNLRALAAHGWGEVAAGQLTEDLAPPGFEAMTDFVVAPRAAAAPAPPPSPTVAAAAPDPAHERIEAARLEAARSERARRAEVVATARAHAAAAHTRLAEAAVAMAAARAEADRAELAWADARARAEAADREVRAATAALEAAP
jgi:hypothetical protein